MENLQIGMKVVKNAPGINGGDNGDNREYEVISVSHEENFITVGWSGKVLMAGEFEDFKKA